MQTNVNGLATLPNHQLAMTLLMTPDMANFMGNVHGGTILKLLDQVAYACASRYAGRYVVTLSVDQVTFREPIHVGELVTFLAPVNYTGNSSLEVGIKVIAENIRTRVSRHATRVTSPCPPRRRSRGWCSFTPGISRAPSRPRRGCCLECRRRAPH